MLNYRPFSHFTISDCQVTLPTFILEKRSLLEMYADFFAHPDLFVKWGTPSLLCGSYVIISLSHRVSEAKTPKERMISATYYYLSTFHTARKVTMPSGPYWRTCDLICPQGTIAKKPYNPILGETFQCYWDLPKDLHSSPSPTEADISSTGPVSWASYNAVAFAAEQVSHHPPSELPYMHLY